MGAAEISGLRTSSSYPKNEGKKKEMGIKTMDGHAMQNTFPTLALQKDQGPASVTSRAVSKPKKKICCACPETKKLRDECVVEHGEAACSKWIEAHRKCLRAEGFNV